MLMSRAVIHSDALLFLWAEAVNTTNFIRNISTHSANDLRRTPHELLYGAKPSIKHLHPFGLKVFAHVPVEARAADSKLLHCAEEGFFVELQVTETRRLTIKTRTSSGRGVSVF